MFIEPINRFNSTNGAFAIYVQLEILHIFIKTHHTILSYIDFSICQMMKPIE